jgi:glycerophosphoryl diester phosphodiesterase
MALSPRTRNVLGTFALLLAGLSLLNASWLADAPMGGPQLLAAKPVDVPRDNGGCITTVQSGYNNVMLAPETQMLLSAAGRGAQAIMIDSEDVGGVAVLPRIFPFTCAADTARARAPLAEALQAVSKPVQFVHVRSAAHAAQILDVLPKDQARRIFFGDANGVAAIKAALPQAKGFAIADARKCASAYRGSGWYGSVPANCRGGTMLLSLDDLGFTLWGWPNRFLARMKEAGTQVIIAESIKGDTITGLHSIEQYGDIASSFNGSIVIDNIAELGPALRR